MGVEEIQILRLRFHWHLLSYVKPDIQWAESRKLGPSHAQENRLRMVYKIRFECFDFRQKMNSVPRLG